MPRGRLARRARRKEMQALRYEQLCHAIKAARRDHHAREAALALRKATPDWVEMDKQLKQLQLEAEMDAMEACLDARRPEIPILNFDLMPGFSPPTKLEPEVHPDVKIQAELTAMQEPRPVNENAPPPRGGKNWKYESTSDDRNPADDWRNWE
ncbi:MAG: hypothetical protein ABJO36_06585 [Litorimonas sp.]